MSISTSKIEIFHGLSNFEANKVTNNSVSFGGADNQTRYTGRRSSFGITRKEIPKKRSPEANNKTLVKVKNVNSQDSKSRGKSLRLPDVSVKVKESIHEQYVSGAQLHFTRSMELGSELSNYDPARLGHMGQFLQPFNCNINSAEGIRFTGTYQGPLKVARRVSTAEVRTAYAANVNGVNALGDNHPIGEKNRGVCVNATADNSEIIMKTSNQEVGVTDCQVRKSKNEWIKDGNWYINDGTTHMKQALRPQEPVQSCESPCTTSVTTTQAISPMEIVITTTSMTSAMVYSGTEMTRPVVSNMAMVTSRVTVTSQTESTTTGSNADGKKKHDEEIQDSKHRNIEKNLNDMNSDEVMHKLLTQMTHIKSSIEEVKVAVSARDEVKETVKNIQEETKAWKERQVQLEKDVSGLKELVEMAHNLIGDEAQEWKQDIANLKTAISEKSVELSNGLQVVKRHDTDIKMLNDTVRVMHGQLDKVCEEQCATSVPVVKLQHQVAELTGGVKYPIQQTIKAQNVWYRENENLE